MLARSLDLGFGILTRSRSESMHRFALSVLLAFVPICGAQTAWSLSGKVVDAEEGNGLGTVEVSLAQAGLRTTTAKNGDWTLGGILGVHARADRSRSTESFLHLADGRLRLRPGVDRHPGAPS